MKNKNLKLVVLGLAMFGVLGFAYRENSNKVSQYAVNSTNSQVITESRAKAIALKEVPGANSSHVTKIELDREHGRMVYEGEIYYKGLEYDFDIDAVTGEVLKWHVDRD
ncbi:MAG: PepSY domain-containing protein [Pseudoleptotrichia goodfellowii]|nr:PepSY domain-containing protein [Pseudoleptotrichia goodfellowii]